MLHLFSTIVLVLIAAGVMLRHRTAIHLRLMATAFAIDLSLVLYIEINRHAVERVVGPAGPLIWFHAFVSLCVLGLYAGQIVLGRNLLAGRAASRQLHRALGTAFVVCRTLNYVTSFMVTSQVPAPASAQIVIESHPSTASAALNGRE